MVVYLFVCGATPRVYRDGTLVNDRTEIVNACQIISFWVKMIRSRIFTEDEYKGGNIVCLKLSV